MSDTGRIDKELMQQVYDLMCGALVKAGLKDENLEQMKAEMVQAVQAELGISATNTGGSRPSHPGLKRQGGMPPTVTREEMEKNSKKARSGKDLKNQHKHRNTPQLSSELEQKVKMVMRTQPKLRQEARKVFHPKPIF